MEAGERRERREVKENRPIGVVRVESGGRETGLVLDVVIISLRIKDIADVVTHVPTYVQIGKDNRLLVGRERGKVGVLVGM